MAQEPGIAFKGLRVSLQSPLSNVGSAVGFKPPGQKLTYRLFLSGHAAAVLDGRKALPQDALGLLPAPPNRFVDLLASAAFVRRGVVSELVASRRPLLYGSVAFNSLSHYGCSPSLKLLGLAAMSDAFPEDIAGSRRPRSRSDKGKPRGFSM